MSSISIIKKVAIVSGVLWASYSIYCYMFPNKKIQTIVPKQILEFKETLEKNKNMSPKHVLFQYPRVELIPFNFVQPFIKTRGYVEHFELSMDEAWKNLLCMFKFGVDMQGYLQYIHNGAILCLLEELKNILLEHYWNQKGQMKTLESKIEYTKPIKLHKTYFFLGEIVATEEHKEERSDDEVKRSAQVSFQVIDEKGNVYFKSFCSCVNVNNKILHL